MGVAPQAPTTGRRLGQQYPRSAGQLRITRRLGNEGRELFDDRQLLLTIKRTQLYVTGGMEAAKAQRVAATVVAASEGAVVVSRAEKSLEPFELVAAQLLDLTG